MEGNFLNDLQREIEAHKPPRKMKFWTTAKAERDKWLAVGRKIEKGASPDDARVIGDRTSCYGELTGRYSPQLQVGLSRLPYKPSVPSTNVFESELFRNTQWKPRLELQKVQASVHSIWDYDMNCVNAAGDRLVLQENRFDVIYQVATSANTDTEKEAGNCNTAMFASWARITGERAGRGPAARMGFYRNSLKDLVAAKLNQEMYENDTHLPANESLDAHTHHIHALRETQLMKAFSALAATPSYCQYRHLHYFSGTIFEATYMIYCSKMCSKFLGLHWFTYVSN